MKKIFTIGFTKKNAETFFELLKKNNVKKVIDVRLNNSSQLAGFSKGDDLCYFLKEIAKIDYIHMLEFAPTKEILDAYKKGTIDWKTYEQKYDLLMEKRHITTYITKKGEDFWKDTCLLCSEETPECCHRRLAAKKIISIFSELVEKDII
ncbi:MAG: DUF488 domain-containing protein [Alphaproteobacteria bacterium]|nr:DUF488 domain-containing protein [Alphaproteobacteria bacterium]